MKKTRIMIVDDEPGFTRMLKLNLEQTGRFEIREENQGTRALATAKEFEPDVILMDIIMPDMDGGQVAAQFKEDGRLKRIPIVYLTAVVSSQEANLHANMIGGRMFVSKPVNMDELIACIEERINAGA